MRLRFTVVLLTVGALCSAATYAQSGAKEKSHEGRARARAGAEERTSIYARIRAQLDLDEQQQAQYDEIAAKYKKSGRKLTAGSAERGVQRKDAAGRDRRANMDAFFDEVDGILRDDQREKLAKIRAERPATRGPGRGGEIAQLRQLQTDLRLNDEQNEQYETRLAELQETIENAKYGGEDLAAIIEEIRAAAEAGDTDRVKELRDQLPDSRAASEQAVAEFLDEIASFLEPEQLEILEAHKQDIIANHDETDLRECFRFVSRLDLDQNQRLTVRELQRDSLKSLRAARRDPAETSRITTETKAKLREMLNDDQTAEYDRWLKEKEKSGRGKRPRQRDGRNEETP